MKRSVRPVQMKAIEQYFHVVLFIVLYKVALTFKSVDETLVCDHSNKSYWAVLSCGTNYYAVQGSVKTMANLGPEVWMKLMRDFKFYTRNNLKLNLLRILFTAINFFS